MAARHPRRLARPSAYPARQIGPTAHAFPRPAMEQMKMPFCVACGTEYGAARFCANCGAATGKNPPAATEVRKPSIEAPAGNPSSIDLDYEAVFIGKNAIYYKTAWAKMDGRNTKTSFNVAAALLGTFWMVYRKLYLHAAIWWGAAIVVSIIGMASGRGDIDTILNGAFLGASVVYGFHANHLYRQHMKKKIEAIDAALTHNVGNEKLALDALKEAGGVNPIGVVVVVVALVVLIIFSSI